MIACLLIVVILVLPGSSKIHWNRSGIVGLAAVGMAQTTSVTSTVYLPLVLNTGLPPSRVVVDNHQAFDRCTLPTIQQMQTWWDHSPYWVHNLYLGGISFACRNNPLDQAWITAVARQGWSFILTWVGPQAPCTTYNNRMSSSTTTAYQQGRSEADLANAAAASLGITGGRVIYYDVESYSGADSACRSAVKSFMRGWVERLHELGAKAGGYGSPCTSYLSEWSTNNPAPDDVWIAYWILPPQYDPAASVWNVPCLSNSLWPNHQRLRQYAGGHPETWGGLSMTIDSSVLDGEIVTFQSPSPATAEGTLSDSQGLGAPQIRDMGALSPESGWVLVGDRLYWTSDAGSSWQEITPGSGSSAGILAVNFLDRQQGWLVRHTQGPAPWGSLAISYTENGGAAWQEFPLPVYTSPAASPVEAAFLDFIDANLGWLAVKLQTGSSFSLGRLFVTQDGGRTWEERSIPLGEPVKFLDAQRGWVAGGPSGELLYRTVDGGRTWQPQALPLPDSIAPAQALVGLPQFENAREGVLPVTISGSPDSQFVLYATGDSGESWGLATSLELDPGFEPGSPLPFSLGAGSRWWVGSSGSARLYTSALPAGVIALDFITDQSGWALAQEGSCQGYKPPSGLETPPFQCALRSRLLATSDGGFSWTEITLP
ncbi:MAG: hypothetical protein A2W36_05635 [Chloroflexi bacterium RBG_16_58_14]|nr:MAG: hypothetical protein A2W36_05635 [Chloroflexi bacterium RBG_16_58_14]